MGVHYLSSTREVEDLLPLLMQAPAWGTDAETTGLDPHTDRVTLLQIGRPDDQYVIDCRPGKASLMPLKPFFESEEIKKVGHNLKFDYKMLKGSTGLTLENVRCTYLAEQVLGIGRKYSGYGLADLLATYLDIKIDKSLQSSFIGHTGDFSKEQIEYAAKDVRYMLPLCQKQAKRLEGYGLQHTWVLECQALPCFGDMEFAGLKLNVEAWRKIMEENQKKADEIKEQLGPFAAPFYGTNLFGEVDFNWDSPKQTLELFQRMGIKIKEVDKDGNEVFIKLNKTDAKTLKKVGDIPIVKLLNKYRGYTIRVTTFGQSFIDAIHPKTGRIHFQVRQLGTETGRPATAKDSPVSMLNIPREKAMRNCFIAEDDELVGTHDYSGCELRIWAEISGDPGLRHAFTNNIDVHCYVAEKLYRKPVTKDNENKHLRTPAKNLNFGIAYGMGPTRLFYELNGGGFPIPMKECKELFYRYTKEEFATGVNYLREAGRQALEQGWASNLSGRRRWWLLPNPNDREKYPNGEEDPKYKGRIGGIEREGGNFKIQSVNADITKYAMVLIRRWAKKEGYPFEFMNQVYDEIVTRTKKTHAEVFNAKKHELMMEAGRRWIKQIPLEVEGDILPYWTK